MVDVVLVMEEAYTSHIYNTYAGKRFTTHLDGYCIVSLIGLYCLILLT